MKRKLYMMKTIPMICSCSPTAKLARLGLLCGLLCALAAEGAEITINLIVQGPGAAMFGTPRPHLEGQSLDLTAQPLPGAQFVGWGDGVISPVRTIIVTNTQTDFTAIFTNSFDPNPSLDCGLQPIDPGNPPRLNLLAKDNAWLRLSSSLPGKHGYRLLSSTALGQETFTPIQFALASNAPLNFVENLGGPGPLELWTVPPTNRSQAFYQLRLDNNLTVPAIYCADAANVAPGADVTFWGANLSGTVVVRSGGTSLTVTYNDSSHIRVTAPGTPGLLLLTATVNGVSALGSAAVTVVAATNAPAITNVSDSLVMPGGVLRLTGTGFGPDTQVWLDNQLLQIVSRAADGTEIYVLLPRLSGTSRLSVVANGVRSAGVNVSFAPSTTLAGPPVSLLLPFNAGPEGLPLNTASASPPVSLLLPANVGPEGLPLNTALASPPVSLLLPANVGLEGVPLNTALAQPPVSIRIGTP